MILKSENKRCRNYIYRKPFNRPSRPFKNSPKFTKSHTFENSTLTCEAHKLCGKHISFQNEYGGIAWTAVFGQRKEKQKSQETTFQRWNGRCWRQGGEEASSFNNRSGGGSDVQCAYFRVCLVHEKLFGYDAGCGNVDGLRSEYD